MFNKKGSLLLTNMVMLLALSGTIIALSFYVYSTTANINKKVDNMNISSVCYYQWRKLQSLNSVNMPNNTVEVSTLENYNIETKFGKKQVTGTDFIIPVTIKSTDLNTNQSYSLEAVLYSKKSNDKYLQNISSPDYKLGLKYDSAKDAIRYFVDDNEVVEEGVSLQTGNGYIKLTNGLIIQWGGKTNIPFYGDYKTEYFPISFPHKCFTVISSTFQPYYIPGMRWCNVYSYDNNKVVFYAWGGGDSVYGYYWLAFGY